MTPASPDEGPLGGDLSGDVGAVAPDYYGLGDSPVKERPVPILTRVEVGALIGSDIDPEVWEFLPWGHRLVVKRLHTPDRVGLIHIPEGFKEPLAIGHVIRVGLEIGTPSVKYAGECPLPLPDLIGTQVMFGKFAGMALKHDTKSDPFESEYLVMHEDDIWGHIRPAPAEAQATKEND